MGSITELNKEQESNRNIDFKQIFLQRLSKIEPFSEEEGKDEAYFFAQAGIEQVKKRAVALVFPSKNEGIDYFDRPLDLWIEDYKDIGDKDYPHYQAVEKLERFLLDNEYNEYIGGLNMRSAYVIQDVKNRIFLLFDEGPAEIPKGDLEFEYGERWVKLIEKYNLENILGDYSDDFMVTPIGGDIVGKIREDNFLRNFAEKYQMTNFQFMRFRTFILSAKKSNTSINYDSVAKEIIAEDL